MARQKPLARLKLASDAARRERDRRRAVRLMARIADEGYDPQAVVKEAMVISDGHLDGEIDVPLEVPPDDGRTWEESVQPKTFNPRHLLRPLYLVYAALLLALILYPLGGFRLIGLDQDKFNTLNSILQYFIIITGLNLIAGFTGLLSLGQSIFTAIGGYMSAIVTVKMFPDWHGGPWVGLAAAVVISVLIALVLALPSLRIK
ncbi:MAG: hypothetical protein LC722_06440, partial [Actinobacteria bacterium]|nr:hypothetical protein [Actinomycetota bacterium]